MYCSKCGQELSEGAIFCTTCGGPLAQEAARTPKSPDQPMAKPLAGIVVGGVLGTIGLLWSTVATFSSLSSDPSGPQAQLLLLFPGLGEVQFLANSTGMIGNAAVLIGALLSFLLHPSGNSIVRITSWAMLAGVVIASLLTAAVVLNLSAWPLLQPEAKASLLGGIMGGLIGGVFQCGLIIFLFRGFR